MPKRWCRPIPSVLLEERFQGYLETIESKQFAAWFRFCIASYADPVKALELKVQDLKGKQSYPIQKASSLWSEYSPSLDAYTLALVDQLCAKKRDTDYVFNKPGTNEPYSYFLASNRLEVAAKHYGIDDITVWSLRKTHVLHVYEISPLVAKKLIGRTSNQDLYEYLGLDVKNLQNQDASAEQSNTSLAIQYADTSKSQINELVTMLLSLKSRIEKDSTELPETFYRELVRDTTSIEVILERYLHKN